MSAIQQDGTLLLPLVGQPRMRTQGKVVLERNQDMRGGGRRRQRGRGWFSNVLGKVKDVAGTAKDAYGLYKAIKGGGGKKGCGRRQRGGMTQADTQADALRKYGSRLGSARGRGRRQHGKGFLTDLLF